MSEKEVYYWYIFRITYRNEKKVKDILDIAGIEIHIPFHAVERSWNNIKRSIEMPVFTGIGFARVDDFDLEVLKLMNEISLFTDKEGKIMTIPGNLKDELFEDPGLLSQLFIPDEE